MLIILDFFLLFLLVLDVLLYHILVKPDRTDEIAACPEMVPPIGLLPHFGAALEKLDRNLPFQCPHQIRHRDFRWHRNEQMHMVGLKVHIFENSALPFEQRPYVTLDQFLYRSRQNTEPVFRDPHNVIITLVNNMAEFPIFTRTTKIGIAFGT